MLYLIVGKPLMTENSQRCAHCNGLLQPINHASSCYWNMGTVCITCGRETYVGEVYSTWKEGEAPSDLLYQDDIPYNTIIRGHKPTKYI